MKLPIRRIGNSYGVIIPKSSLDAWGVAEGDHLTLTSKGIQPSPPRSGLSQEEIDTLNREISVAVVRRFSAREIRAQILGNLHRWKRQGTWVSAYDEWRKIAETQGDGELFAAMLGHDEEAVRLRSSMPYVGLLSAQEMRALHEQASA